jgi:hypothetical protein
VALRARMPAFSGAALGRMEFKQATGKGAGIAMKKGIVTQSPFASLRRDAVSTWVAAGTGEYAVQLRVFPSHRAPEISPTRVGLPILRWLGLGATLDSLDHSLYVETPAKTRILVSRDSIRIEYSDESDAEIIESFLDRLVDAIFSVLPKGPGQDAAYELASEYVLLTS